MDFKKALIRMLNTCQYDYKLLCDRCGSVGWYIIPLKIPCQGELYGPKCGGRLNVIGVRPTKHAKTNYKPMVERLKAVRMA